MVHPCKQLGQLIVHDCWYFFSIHCCLASKERSHSLSASSRGLCFVLDVHASNSVVVVVQLWTSESAEMSWSYRWLVVPRPYRAGRLKALRYGIQAFSALCRMCLTLAHLFLLFLLQDLAGGGFQPCLRFFFSARLFGPPGYTSSKKN